MGKETDKVLLNLGVELHREVSTAAKAERLSVTEYIREAIRLKLAKPAAAPVDLFTQALGPAAEPAGNVAEQPVIRGTDSWSAEQVRRPDNRSAEYWLTQITIWREMAPNYAYAAFLQSSGGRRPPAATFANDTELAKWLEDNAQ